MQITKTNFIFPLTGRLSRAVFSITEIILLKAKLRLGVSEQRLHEDNASLISSKLELSKSEDKISGPNLYSHVKFNRKTEAELFFIWKNFKSIHFSPPLFFLGVAKCDNAENTEVLEIAQESGPSSCEVLDKISLEKAAE